MFLNRTILKRLMKQAYKTGLTVAMNSEGWLYMAGTFWKAQILKDYIPKETMGDLISLIGELPEPGERMICSPDGNQMEFGKTLEIDMIPWEQKKKINVSPLILVSKTGTGQRMLQAAGGGEIYLINDVFISLIDSGHIMRDKGETEPYSLTFCSYGILWQNNVCRLSAPFRTDEQNEDLLDEMSTLFIAREELPDE